MKNIIAALILLAMTAVSYAGSPVCEMKRNQRDYAECYAFSVRGGQIRMQKNYDRISASSKVTQEEKQYINQNHNDWATSVDKHCRDNICVYDSLSARNSEIEQFMRKHGLEPI